MIKLKPTSDSPIIMPSSHFAFILGLVAITTCLATNEHDQDALGAQYEELRTELKDHEMQIIQIKTQMSQIKEKLSTGTLLATKNRQEDLLGESAGGRRRKSSVPTNKAKCACPSSGTCNNNQEVVVGTHNCEVDADGGSSTKGNACPDDLSMGKFWLAKNSNGKGDCKPFDETKAVSGSVSVVPSSVSTAHSGMVTKMKVAHPHNADKRVGVLAAKRIICSGSVCEIFKAISVCSICQFDIALIINLPSNPFSLAKAVNCFRVPSSNGFKFADKAEAKATDAELKTFVDQVTANAWDDAGTANAKIKSNWKCTSTDMEHVLGWSAAF